MLTLGGGPVDRAVYETLYAGDRPALLAAARFFTFLGEPTVLIGAGVIVAVWLWTAGHRHFPMVLVAIVALGRGLSEAQKYWIGRVRPDIEPHMVVVKTSSFPSGHATSSMIFYLTVALVLTKGSRWHRFAAGAAVILSLLIGTSRVMLGVHWPSDVVGGWSFGMLWVLLTLRLAGRFVKGYDLTLEGGRQMTRPFTWIASAIFALMTIVHIYRLFTHFQITVGSHSIPESVSYVAIVITAGLSWMLCREARGARGA